MTTIHRRAPARFRWLLTAALLLITGLAAASPALAKNKLTCGKPTKSGPMRVQVIVFKGPPTVRETKEVTVQVEASWSAEQKADSIRAAFGRLGIEDTLKATGNTALITFEGQNFWGVENIALIRDDDQQPDQISLGVPPSDQEALCSLAGTASGRNVTGGPGFVRLVVGGVEVVQPTQPGMPAMVVEQMLIGRLNSAGVPARWATPGDFAGGSAVLPHDNFVIWFPIADSTGFLEEITDQALSLDLASVLNRNPEATSAVPIWDDASGLRLDVWPSVFSHGAVSVRFSAETADSRVHLEIFDIAGRRMRTLVDGGAVAAGAISWDGRDDGHSIVPGGVYLVRLATPSGSVVRRVVRVRN